MARIFRILRGGVVLAAFFILLALIAAKLDGTADTVMSGPFYAIDGDTLSAGGERLRLQGIDAPEIDQTCEDDRGMAWACGREARRLLAQLVTDPQTECLGRERDRYRRLLVRCRAGAAGINAALVRQGLAIASGLYAEEQAAARRERQGLWAGHFESPRDWRASRGMMEAPNLLETVVGWMKQMAGRG
ncbi:thermonuclease family protein [Rhizobium puerariae]|uniref:Thermonuclease family protein n=1 Tax=Rhizobium puerariae TaxID=1585791 RepID=A0ABV6APT4_9HYPH